MLTCAHYDDSSYRCRPYDSKQGGRKSVWGGKKCKFRSAQEIAEQKSFGDHRELAGCCTECMKHSTVQRDCFCQQDPDSADPRVGKCLGVNSRTTLAAVACDMVSMLS